MKLLKILVIDDEKLIRWSFEEHFSADDVKIFLAETGEEGLELYQTHLPDIVFVDNKLPGIQGLEVINRIKSFNEDAVIVFMTAFGSIDTAVMAMKNGASEYINKPFSINEIEILIDNICRKINLTQEIEILKRDQREKITFDNIVGESSIFRQIIVTTKKIARSETTTILLTGDSGTGKDIFAHAIHNESTRKDNPFVTINCATFPETLLESELFGHEKGAFTDAKKLKKGLFEIAETGTVFLDEIGEINLATQVKLLSVLENRTIKRLGGTVEIPVNIRIIAATNKDLVESVEQKSFREDLYYRLKVFQIDLPPLREHKEDIPHLISFFIKRFNAQFRKNIRDIDPVAKNLMLSYKWPGNIRELRNVMERAIILENNEVIQAENLPYEISESMKSRSITDSSYTFLLPDDGISLEELEKEMIHQALEKTDYNQTRAAGLLGISRDTLRYKQKKHGL